MNSINIISPYKYLDMWVFDDPKVGLIQESFVNGADAMMDMVVKDIPDAGRGFILLFSGDPFPGNVLRLVWRRSESGGNWYYFEDLNMEGWLCPALLKYFSMPPRELYFQVNTRSK